MVAANSNKELYDDSNTEPSDIDSSLYRAGTIMLKNEYGSYYDVEVAVLASMTGETELQVKYAEDGVYVENSLEVEILNLVAADVAIILNKYYAGTPAMYNVVVKEISK